MSDPFGNIELKDPDKGPPIAEAIPVIGKAVKTFSTAADADEDGSRSLAEQSGVTADATGFIQSCMDAGGAVTDPIGWLVGQGLDFLLAVCQPLQDAIHFVSGDGPALGTAAGNFNSIGQGLEQFAQQFADEARQSLSLWDGPAAEKAATKLGDFANGISGTADKAGDIATLLQISSMVMTVIEDFIKALLTEFITWLIMIWIPALAAAVPTFGGSTAAAGAATGIRAGMTASRAATQVSKLQRLLDMIMTLIEKLKVYIKKAHSLIAKMKHTDMAGIASRRTAGFGSSVRTVLGDTATSQVNIQSAPGKPAGHMENARKAAEYGATGDGQSVEETRDNLNF